MLRKCMLPGIARIESDTWPSDCDLEFSKEVCGSSAPCIFKEGNEVILHHSRSEHEEGQGFADLPQRFSDLSRVPTYRGNCGKTLDRRSLRGEPLCCGRLLKGGETGFSEEVELSLFVNGFFYKPCVEQNQFNDGAAVVRTWWPFTIVYHATLRAATSTDHDCDDKSNLDISIFSITEYGRGNETTWTFATQGPQASHERALWTGRIASALGMATESLFPKYTIAVHPVPNQFATRGRIMAGYLIIQGDSLSGRHRDTSWLCYCELQSYSQGSAHIAFYSEENCEHRVALPHAESIRFSSDVSIKTCAGEYSTLFAVGRHQFCARTIRERDLWLRAVSNVWVKLQYKAPDPTTGELASFRESVLDSVGNANNGDNHFFAAWHFQPQLAVATNS